MGIREAVKLEEQLRFINRSSEFFDNGIEEEAIRIATALRVIFHNRGSSKSLIHQLGLEKIPMLSSSKGHRDWQDYLGQIINFTSPNPISMIPLLGNKFKKTTYELWWQKETVFRHQGDNYTRSKIVRSMANKDGGAHVDPKLEQYYEVLCSGRFAAGIAGDFEFGGNPPPFEQGVTIYPSNAHLALLRQFAHETLHSLKNFRYYEKRSG